ncbi:MAG TPA: protein kinase [Pirellulales bacterium]
MRFDSAGAPQPPGGGSSIAPAKTTSQPDDMTVISDRLPTDPVKIATRPPQPFELGKLLAGDRLGHFELLEYVGGGGMGAVFRARDTMLDREVALKVLSRAQGADDETRRRFHVEAQSAARLDHPNIARVYYVGEDQGLNFIVFEFIRGVNIRELVERQGALPLGDAVSFTLQIAEALAHASQRSVVHRDIKPSNIIVTEEGRAKLVDMGLARLHARTANDDLTASGVTLGTFDYISPEQARDPRMADVRSDIYSLGCTLYYMLTARPPFPEGTVLQKLLQHQADDVPDPRQFNPAVPDALAELLRRMLAKDPRRRFQEPGELIGELLLLADRLNLQPFTTGQFWLAPQSDNRALWERHLPWLLPVAALAMIVLGLEWSSSLSVSVVPDAELSHSRGTPAPIAPDRIAARRRETAEQPSTKAHSPDALATDATSDTTASDDKSVSVPPRNPVTPANDTVQAPTQVNTESDANVRRASNIEPTAEIPASPGKSKTSSPPPADLAGAATVGDPDTSFGITAAPQEQADLSVGSPRGTDRQPDEVRQPVESIARRPNSETTNADDPLPAVRPTVAAILSSDGGPPRQFASLKSACSAAKNNDVIELRYNDVREEDPIELSNLKLTIRAGEGFQPIVAFRTGRLGITGFGRSMITVAGGRLSLRDIGLVLDIPRESTADGWSLFETRQPEQLRLDGCTLTIRNPEDGGTGFHGNVSFFDIKAAPGVDTMMKTPESPPVHPVNLDLQNCIVRGEAIFVRSIDAQPIALDWENGFLAITEAFFLAEGTSTSPPAGERVDIRLNHLTAIAGGGLIRLIAAADAPHLLKTEVNCANSFLITRDTPLVEQRGPQRTAMLEQQFQWSGDRNFCQGFSVFWHLVDLNAATQPRLITALQWQSQMGAGDKLVASSERPWKRASIEDQPIDMLRPEDFVLADRLRGPAGPYIASDLGEVGFERRKLPTLPPDPPPFVRPRESQRRPNNSRPLGPGIEP